MFTGQGEWSPEDILRKLYNMGLSGLKGLTNVF